jgi:hypothetical protein
MKEDKKYSNPQETGLKQDWWDTQKRKGRLLSRADLTMGLPQEPIETRDRRRLDQIFSYRPPIDQETYDYFKGEKDRRD